jgi:hypothetical protein
VKDELIAGHLSSAAVHVATIELLRPALSHVTPPQYGVFSLARSKLTLLNLNNDGLADAYCAQHRVLNLHGTSLSPAQREAIGWDRLLDALQVFPALKAPRVPGLVLPQKEPEALADTPMFTEARRLLKRSNRIAVAGYSFGAGDDWIVEEMVVEAMRSGSREALVASPDPSTLAARLENAGESTVRRLPVRWDALSEAISASIGRHFFKSCPTDRLCARCIGYLYGATYDSLGKLP